MLKLKQTIFAYLSIIYQQVSLHDSLYLHSSNSKFVKIRLCWRRLGWFYWFSSFLFILIEPISIRKKIYHIWLNNVEILIYDIYTCLYVHMLTSHEKLWISNIDRKTKLGCIGLIKCSRIFYKSEILFLDAFQIHLINSTKSKCQVIEIVICI